MELAGAGAALWTGAGAAGGASGPPTTAGESVTTRSQKSERPEKEALPGCPSGWCVCVDDDGDDDDDEAEPLLTTVSFLSVAGTSPTSVHRAWAILGAGWGSGPHPGRARSAAGPRPPRRDGPPPTTGGRGPPRRKGETAGGVSSFTPKATNGVGRA